MLARLDCCGICIGLCKGSTVGACGIWYVIDIVLTILDDLPDQYGVPVYNDM